MRTTAILLGAVCALSGEARAQDGPTILRKMRAAYAALHSYSHEASVTVAVRSGESSEVTGNTGVVRFQRPNRLYVSVSAPQTGTFVSASNGREQVLYRSKTNQYERRPAPATLEAAIRSLTDIYVDTTMLDPLYFLQGKELPPTVTGLKAKGRANVNGVPCYVVEATARARTITGAVGTQRITFWVDRKTYLLRRMQMTYAGVPISVPVVSIQNGKRVMSRRQMIFSGTISEVIQDIQVNPRLDESAFTYAMPKGATEIDIDRLLGRKK